MGSSGINARVHGDSLEKLLELKLSRWSLLSSFCPSLAWPLPRALLSPGLSQVLGTWRPSRHGSWPSSSTLLTHSHSWLDTEEAGGLSLFPALFPESETSPPNKLGSCNSRPTSTWFPSGQLLQEGQRGLFPSQEHLRSSPWRATHRPRLSGTGPNKLTRPNLLLTTPRLLLLAGRRGPTLLPTFPSLEPLLSLPSPLNRLLSGTRPSFNKLRMKLLLPANKKTWTLCSYKLQQNSMLSY